MFFHSPDQEIPLNRELKRTGGDARATTSSLAAKAMTSAMSGAGGGTLRGNF